MNIPRDILGDAPIDIGPAHAAGVPFAQEEKEALEMMQAGMKKNTPLDPENGKAIMRGFLAFSVFAALGIAYFAKRK